MWRGLTSDLTAFFWVGLVAAKGQSKYLILNNKKEIIEKFTKESD
jgi:hypothetical protein